MHLDYLDEDERATIGREWTNRTASATNDEQIDPADEDTSR